MKRFFIRAVKVVLLVSLGSGIFVSCGDDDEKDVTISGALANADPSYGFIVNSTDYQLLIDFGEKEKFDLKLAPRQMLYITLKENRTYVMHVVVLNNEGGAIADYNEAFFIDNVPLDNQFRDIVCSWYFEFTSNYPEYGFANNSGT